MLYSIIIVEDEYLLRQKLIQRIDWEYYQCKVVHECDSAEEAIAFVEKNGFPDILFTDVKLIQMNGIELCKYFYENNPQTKKVIMTGYDFFDYAKQAIQYEVNNYSLKPISNEEIGEILIKLTHEIFAQRHNYQELNDLKLFVEDNRRILVENLLIELSASNNAYNAPNNFLQIEKQKLKLQLRNYFYVIINYKLLNEENSLEAKLQLKNFLDEQLGFYGDSYSFGFEYQRICCVIVPHKTKMKIDEIIESIFNKIPIFNQNITFSAGISLMHEDCSTIRKAYEQANAAVSYDFYFGLGSIIHFQDIEKNQSSNPTPSEAFNSEEIITNLRVGDWEKSQAILNHRFENMKREKAITLQMLQTSAIELTNTIYNSIYASNTQWTVPNLTHDIYRISKSSSLEEMQQVLNEIIETCGVQVQTRFLKHTHGAVMKILDYLNEHYQEQITLDSLANIVYLNPKYICNIIKKDTGKTFLEILTEIRIEKAKIMMEDMSYKMYKISQMSGFCDTKAFNAAFKKHTGMTPTEYRNRIKK